MSQPHICIVGAANIDLTSYVPRQPAMGETLHGTAFAMGYGGKGANQAVMAARLGARVSFVAKLGRDVFGQGYLKHLEGEGVDLAHVSLTDEAFSGVATIAVDPAGGNAIVVVTGANNLLSPSDVEAAAEAIRSADVLVCQLETPVETSVRALQLAREAGVRTILNPAPARADLPPELYVLADVFCPNEYEACVLTGQTVGTLEDAAEAGRALLRRGVPNALLTLGERGSLLVTAEGTVHAPAPQVKAVDTTGAGDAFVGSLACYLAQGRGLPDAMRCANAIAALSVQKRGTQTSYPRWDELPAELR